MEEFAAPTLVLLPPLPPFAELLLENATFLRPAPEFHHLAPLMLSSPSPHHADPTLEFVMFNWLRIAPVTLPPARLLPLLTSTAGMPSTSFLSILTLATEVI